MCQSASSLENMLISTHSIFREVLLIPNNYFQKNLTPMSKIRRCRVQKVVIKTVGDPLDRLVHLAKLIQGSQLKIFGKKQMQITHVLLKLFHYRIKSGQAWNNEKFNW